MLTINSFISLATILLWLIKQLSYQYFCAKPSTIKVSVYRTLQIEFKWLSTSNIKNSAPKNAKNHYFGAFTCGN